jgi:predicted ferric reductase
LSPYFADLSGARSRRMMEAKMSKIGKLAKVNRDKKIVLLLIVLTSLTPLFFLSLQEPSRSLVTFKLLAKTGSLTVAVVLVWQFLLGFRGLVSRVLKDLVWAVDLHKKLGIMAGAMILVHPVFITFYYLEKHNRNILLLNPARLFDFMVITGIAALLILLLLVVTSTVLREKFSARGWYLLHLTSYLMIPMVFLHSFMLGMTINNSALKWVWAGFASAAVVGFVYRLFFRLGLTAIPYKISEVQPVASDVVEITMVPDDKKIEPRIGQFIYFRRGPRGTPRPYTVSDFDAKTGAVSISVKAAGETSTALQDASPGEAVAIDGPYGVFTWDAVTDTRPLVMIAGGIGITPFRRLIRFLEKQTDRTAFLFYGNTTEKEIIYKEEFDTLRNVRIIHVLDGEPEYEGEKGYITTDLLEKYLRRDLKECIFLVCGPPVMVTKLEEAMREAGVPDSQIHHELFL